MTRTEMRHVKILAIMSVGYQAGGAEILLVKLNRYLFNEGYSTKTLASDLGPDQEHFNDFTFKNISSTGIYKFIFFLFNPFSFFALRKVLKKYKPDIVHLHVMHEVSPSVLFLLKRYPTIMTLHGAETFLSNLVLWRLKPSNFKKREYHRNELNLVGRLTFFYFNYLQKYVYKRGLKNVDLFIVPSKYFYETVRGDVSPVVHLPNFIDLQQFHELTNNYNLLYVGRLEKVKGVEFLIQALSLIIQAFPQTRLTIVGDGHNKGDLINLTKKLTLEKYVHFAGWGRHEDLQSFYEKASLVIIPSVVPESFAIVCCEAMSAGRPVIGTNVGGIPEIIDDGINGYLVEPEDPEQIAEKVTKLFSEEAVLKELGRNARMKAEEFSIEKHMAKLKKIYESVMSAYESQNISS